MQANGNSLKGETLGEATEKADWAYQYLSLSDGVTAYNTAELMLLDPSFPRIVMRG